MKWRGGKGWVGRGSLQLRRGEVEVEEEAEGEGEQNTRGEAKKSIRE